MLPRSPGRATVLALIATTRLVLGAITWVAIAIVAQLALFPPDGGIPQFGAVWRLWVLPCAWAAATLGGTGVAAGGGLAAPWARAAPLLAFAAWLVIGSAAVLTPAALYVAWAGSLVTAGYGGGLWLATRRNVTSGAGAAVQRGAAPDGQTT